MSENNAPSPLSADRDLLSGHGSPLPGPASCSSLPERSVVVIVPAAGHGARFGDQANKLFAILDGKPLWTHCVQRLSDRPEVDQVLVAVSASDLDRFVEETRFLSKPGRVRFVMGGAERSDTVQAALNQAFSSHQVSDSASDQVAGGQAGDSACEMANASLKFVAVHDAARPLIRDAELTAVFEKAAETGAAILAHRVTGTLKRELPDNLGCQTVSREGMWEAQTPQVFRLDWMRQAYARHRGRPVTDDAQAIERLGHPVALVNGAADNLKITYPEDLRIAEALKQIYSDPKQL
ncbi:IspD/TarI family cytidylyltransferase [Neorhodopirellula lusitana]|uniref:IspD/TarI family cytidylyltransferase n=1 Tax=Neorhodopirellula lusitana TaxID=445327 RepID=UPI003850798A